MQWKEIVTERFPCIGNLDFKSVDSLAKKYVPFGESDLIKIPNSLNKNIMLLLQHQLNDGSVRFVPIQSINTKL